jgi:hypothetical protein
MTDRRRLPDRRVGLTFNLSHNWTPAGVDQWEHVRVQVGYDLDGMIREVFLDPLVPDGRSPGLTSKEHQRPANTLRDLATTISIALQYGTPLDVLAAAMGHGDVNVLGNTIDHPHTLEGALLRELLRYQADLKSTTKETESA